MTTGPSEPDSGAGRMVGSAAILAAGNVASRILGLIREQFIAAHWGGTLEASAFGAALRVPTIIYDLLIGGMLSAALVPVLSAFGARRRDELWAAASVLTSVAAAISGLLGAGVYLFAPQIADLLAHDLGTDGVAIVGESLRYVAPAVLAFGIAGVLTGLFYALERFTLAAVAAASYNATFLVTAIAFREHLQIYALPLAVAAGGLGQVVILAFGLRGGQLRPSFDLRHPALRRVVLLYLPIGAGLLVSQAQVAADTRLATQAGAAALAWMRYATTLAQFPHGLIAVAISLAILPRLSATHSRSEADAFARVLARAVRVVVVLSLPAAVGLSILGAPVVEAIFERGAFGAADKAAVVLALYGYMLGLPFASVDWPLNYAFYARQNTITPALVGVASVGAYLAAALLLGPTANVLGLPASRVFLGLVIADSAKHIVHATTMLYLARRRMGPSALRDVGRSALRSGAAALLMGLVVWLLDHQISAFLAGGALTAVLRATIGASVGAAVYWWLARAVGIEELSWLVGAVRQRLA